MSSEKTRILMVDDEPNILDGYRRHFGRKYQLVTATSGSEALEVMDAEGEFPVVITDMRMPGMDGLAFLQEATKKHADSVYMMLTGNADQQTAIDAINKGSVYRFLNKPCAPEELEQAIHAGLRQYDLVRAERVLLRETLSGSVKLLLEIMTLSHPKIGHLTTVIRNDISEICKEMKMPGDWRIPLAASLSMLGCIVDGGAQDVSQLTDEYLERCAGSGAKLIRNIPRLKEVSIIVENQREVGLLPQNLDLTNSDTRVLVASHILRFLVDLHRETESFNGNKIAALRTLKSRNHIYDKQITEVASDVLLLTDEAQQKSRMRCVHTQVEISSLEPGMEVDEDILTKTQMLLVAKGQTLTTVMIDRLSAFGKDELAADVVMAYVPQIEGR